VQKDRKKTQRERILAGMIDAVARDGYAAATVAQVIAHAGVSRPTFYDYFTDKIDCFVAALFDIQEQLTADVRKAVQGEPPQQATHAAVAALVQFADSQSTLARALLNEAMAGGSRALDARDCGLAAIEEIIEQRYRAVDQAIPAPDLSARVLVGGIYRLLASRLRRGEQDTAGLVEELQAWIRCYEQPLGEHRWRVLRAVSLPAPSSVVGAPLQPPGPLPSGRARLSKQEVAENHRHRLLVAVARLAEEKGYAATTIGDITKLAHVDTRVFYRLFTDKREAFRALHQLLFQRIMAVTAAGFISGGTWPERIWEGGRAFAHYVEQEPTLAYASFVDSHAGDAETMQRVEELVTGFTLFLQEGYQYKPLAARPSSLALQAIAMTVFELDYSQVRESRVRQLSGVLPHVTFLALAPFIGPVEANRFIDRRLAGAEQSVPRD
jgi:AcrR family transcriptional regulator